MPRARAGNRRRRAVTREIGTREIGTREIGTREIGTEENIVAGISDMSGCLLMRGHAHRFVALLAVACLFAAAVSGLAAERDDDPTSAGQDAGVSYYNDVRPLLQAHCHGCHQPAKAGGDFVMTSYDALLRGGESELAAIVPGKPEESYLVEQITPVDGQAEMPKEKPPLSSAHLALIQRWIAEGAINDTPAQATARFNKDNPPQYTTPPTITSLDYSPDGNLLAVSGFHEVLVFQADGSRCVARLIGMSDRIESAVFSPDGTRLAVTGGRPARMGEVQIWNTADWTLMLSVPVTYDTVYGASWSPDGRFIAFGCSDNSVRAIDSQSGEQVLLQRAPNDWTLDTAFSVDGAHIVSVGRDMTVKLFERETERFVDNITSITPGALKGGIHAVQRHPSRDEVAVGGDDGVLRAYRLFRQTKRRIGDDSNLVRRFPAMPGRIFDVDFSADGARIVAGSSFNGTGAVHVFSAEYDSEMPEEIKKIEAKALGGRSAEERKKLEQYRESDVRLVAAMAGQHAGVFAVAFRPDGNAVASGGYDGVVRLNDPSTGALLSEFAAVPLQDETPTGSAPPSSETVSPAEP